MAGCLFLEPIEKTPAVERRYLLDLINETQRVWRPRSFFPINIRLRPGGVGDSGFEYEVTAAGQTGQRPPEFPQVIGQAVMSGSVELTCRAISAASLFRSVVSQVWSAPAGISVTADGILDADGEQRLAVLVAGGTVNRDYIATAVVSFDDGTVEEYGLRIHICRPS